MFKYLCFYLMMGASLAWAGCQHDVYEIDTDPKKLQWSIRHDTLLLDHLQHYQLVKQPADSRHSLIVDTSNQHILFSLEKGYAYPLMNQSDHVEFHIYPSACLAQSPYLHILLDAGHGVRILALYLKMVFLKKIL